MTHGYAFTIHALRKVVPTCQIQRELGERHPES